MTPKSIQSFYKTLQNTLSPIKENNNMKMKNLKSLNDFVINEATVVMDATDTKSKILAKLLKKHKVTMEVIDKNGPSGFPEVELTGYRKDLEKVLAAKDGWDDADLKDYIEEGLGISTIKVKLLNEEYIESMDSIEIANALGKIKTLWDDWSKGPMTEPSDIKPAQKELKGWMDRWFKQNIK